MENNVYCPLMGGKVESGICFDICSVVEFGAPEWTAPEAAMKNLEYKTICKSCENHRED